MYCDSPAQSVLAALGGGLVGGFAGVELGFGVLGVVLLAGVLGGAADLGAHFLRRDPQFRAAVRRARDALGT